MPDSLSTTFVSYARADVEFVLPLVHDLRAVGAALWLDQLDIKPGESWDRAIETALRECSRLVVVLSPDSIVSSNVMDEITFALKKDKQIIPLLYRDCDIPYRLERKQYIDFRQSYDTGLRQLLAVLGSPAYSAGAAMERSLGHESIVEQGSSGVGVAVQPAKVQPRDSIDKASAFEARFRQNKWFLFPLAGFLLVLLTILVIVAKRVPVPEKQPPNGGAGSPPVQLSEDQAGKADADNGRDREKKGSNSGSQESAPKSSAPNLVEAQLLYDRDHQYYVNRQYDQAIQMFTKALQFAPNHFGIYNDRGLAHYDKKEYDLAIEDYDVVVKLNPNLATAYYNRGLAHRGKGQFSQAIHDFNKALQLDTQMTEVYDGLGQTHTYMGQYDLAILDFDKELRTKSTSYAYYNRGSVYLLKSEAARAIEDFDEAIKLSPDDSAIYNRRGLAYEQLKQYPEALRDFDQALRLTPGESTIMESRRRVSAKLTN